MVQITLNKAWNHFLKYKSQNLSVMTCPRNWLSDVHSQYLASRLWSTAPSIWLKARRIHGMQVMYNTDPKVHHQHQQTTQNNVQWLCILYPSYKYISYKIESRMSSVLQYVNESVSKHISLRLCEWDMSKSSAKLLNVLISCNSGQYKELNVGWTRNTVEM